MAKELHITATADKETKYKELLPQIKVLIAGERDQIANLANVAAALKQAFAFYWVGFYMVRDGELVLGPFQGPVACTRIGPGKGVCGTAWVEKRTILVPDVDRFPGHIACSSASRSEIVVPVFERSGEVTLVLDVDSDKLNDFDEVDEHFLMKIVELL
jgi:GAF domain-containing protein